MSNKQELTTQDAIKWVRNRMCEGRYIPGTGELQYDECWQAGAMAIEALEKQLSKPVQGEPLNHDVKINNCTFRKGTRILAICPSCGEWVNKHHKHCSECGQAIDWSDNE